MRLRLPVVGPADEADILIASELLHSDASMQAVQRGLDRAAAYEASDDVRPVVGLLTAEREGDRDFAAANQLMHARAASESTAADAMKRGLDRAAAYEASDGMRPVVGLLTAEREGDRDFSSCTNLLHNPAAVLASVGAMRAACVRAVQYEAADALQPSGFCADPSSRYIGCIAPLWTDMTSVDASIDLDSSMSAFFDVMKQGLARRQRQLLIRQDHQDELLLKQLAHVVTYPNISELVPWIHTHLHRSQPVRTAIRQEQLPQPQGLMPQPMPMSRNPQTASKKVPNAITNQKRHTRKNVMVNGQRHKSQPTSTNMGRSSTRPAVTSDENRPRRKPKADSPRNGKGRVVSAHRLPLPPTSITRPRPQSIC